MKKGIIRDRVPYSRVHHSDPGKHGWPTPRHTEMLDVRSMHTSKAASGMQLVYNVTQYPELITAVRGGNAAWMPSGHDPNRFPSGHDGRTS